MGVFYNPPLLKRIFFLHLFVCMHVCACAKACMQRRSEDNMLESVLCLYHVGPENQTVAQPQVLLPLSHLIECLSTLVYLFIYFVIFL